LKLDEAKLLIYENHEKYVSEKTTLFFFSLSQSAINTLFVPRFVPRIKKAPVKTLINRGLKF
jgi:hypothetical protein